ncbi:MAG: NAD(P)/FAD-dependent oxidoreductase [Thermodesulfobacteriota bacterium]
MTTVPKGALLQRDKTTYAIKPRTPLGVLTPEILEAVARVVRRFGVKTVKMTSGQRLILIGIQPEDFAAVQAELGELGTICVHYVQACPGVETCMYGVRDSMGLGQRLEEIVGPMQLPAKVKVGVSGCPFSCGESFVRDVGLVGRKNGWTVLFGGNSAWKPRFGDVVAQNLSDENALACVQACLRFYAANGKHKERTARFMERVGVDMVRQELDFSASEG